MRCHVKLYQLTRRRPAEPNRAEPSRAEPTRAAISVSSIPTQTHRPGKLLIAIWIYLISLSMA